MHFQCFFAGSSRKKEGGLLYKVNGYVKIKRNSQTKKRIKRMKKIIKKSLIMLMMIASCIQLMPSAHGELQSGGGGGSKEDISTSSKFWQDIPGHVKMRALSFLHPEEAYGFSLASKNSNNVFNKEYRCEQAALVGKIVPVALKNIRPTVEPSPKAGIIEHNIETSKGLLFTYYGCSEVYLWDGKNHCKHLEFLDGNIECIVTLPNKKIIFGYRAGKISVWDPSKKQHEPDFLTELNLKSSEKISQLSLLNDEQIVIALEHDVRIWNISTGEIQVIFNNRNTSSQHRHYSNREIRNILPVNGSKIVIGLQDETKQLLVYNCKTKKIKPIHSHYRIISTMCHLSHEKILVGYTREHTYNIIDISDEQDSEYLNTTGETLIERQFPSSIRSIKILDNKVILAYRNGRVEIWDLSEIVENDGNYNHTKRPLHNLEFNNDDRNDVIRKMFAIDTHLFMFSYRDSVNAINFEKRMNKSNKIQNILPESMIMPLVLTQKKELFVFKSETNNLEYYDFKINFKEKMKISQDPRDYEQDGAGVYEILFGVDGFNRWLKKFFHDRNQIINNPAINEKDPLFNQKAIDKKILAEKELVDVLKYWLEKNVILIDGALQPHPNLNVDWLVQAELIIKNLIEIKSLTFSQKRFESLGENNSVQNWRNMLQVLIKKTSISDDIQNESDDDSSDNDAPVFAMPLLNSHDDNSSESKHSSNKIDDETEHFDFEDMPALGHPDDSSSEYESINSDNDSDSDEDSSEDDIMNTVD